VGTNSYEGRDSFTRTRTHISKVFTQYDKDQSGYLDPVEFDEVFPQKEPYISAKKALHLIYRNIGLFVCVCVCVCVCVIWILASSMRYCRRKGAFWAGTQARWTLSLPQTSRANPVQCCSTHRQQGGNTRPNRNLFGCISLTKYIGLFVCVCVCVCVCVI